MIEVVPSILAAPFGRLEAEVAAVMAAGARIVHVDVMDGHFVPPLSMGPQVVEALAPPVHAAGGEVEVHLMVERPERHVEAFATAGADAITVHVEATPHVHYALQAVERAGCRPGLALNPATPAEAVSEVLDLVGLVLCMTVNPGWGGQPFIGHSPAKLRRLRELVGPDLPLEVDGGIDEGTAGTCVEAGATHLVAGTALFGAEDPVAAFRAIDGAARRAAPPGAPPPRSSPPRPAG